MHYEKFADGTVKCIEDEIPFELPEGWAWCRLKNVISLSSGKSIKVRELTNDAKYSVYGGNGINGTYTDYNVEPNTIVIGRVGFYCGSVYKTKDKAWVTDNALICTVKTPSIFDVNFLVLLLRHFDLGKTAVACAQPVVSGRGILPLVVPVPPINEQVKIQDSYKMALPYIESIEDNSATLKSIISLTKSKILDLAIRGKLVSQDPSDEPASVLLERIRAEKEELIKQGKIKRDKKESIIFKGEDNSYYEKLGNTDVCIDHKLPFTLPDGWTWCVLPEIAEIIMGSSPDGTTINNSNEGIEFHQGKIFFTNKMLNPSDKSTTQPSKIAPKDSVLLCVRAPVGELNITDRSICIGRGLASIHPYHYIDAEWLFYWLQTYKGYLNMKATGSTFVAITADIVKTILMPLPPLKEQEEILKTINKVFFIVDLIEKSLN